MQQTFCLPSVLTNELVIHLCTHLMITFLIWYTHLRLIYDCNSKFFAHKLIDLKYSFLSCHCAHVVEAADWTSPSPVHQQVSAHTSRYSCIYGPPAQSQACLIQMDNCCWLHGLSCSRYTVSWTVESFLLFTGTLSRRNSGISNNYKWGFHYTDSSSQTIWFIYAKTLRLEFTTELPQTTGCKMVWVSAWLKGRPKKSKLINISYLL